jgi:hypothetical protein
MMTDRIAACNHIAGVDRCRACSERNELIQLRKVVDDYEVALTSAAYDFCRISTADWTAEMMAMCAEASEGRILLILDKYSVEKE